MSFRTKLLKIARDARKRYSVKWPNQCSYGQCDDVSWALADELEELGIPAIVIMGLVATEDPVWLETDLDDETKEELGIPLDKFAAYHYWIEAFDECRRFAGD